MRFKISRRSDRAGEKAPCAEALKAMAPVFDERACTEDYFNSNLAKYYHGGLWREEGNEHQILPNGHIRRRLADREVWVVEIETLDDLVEFSKKYGELVLNFKDCLEIEIYDDYRE